METPHRGVETSETLATRIGEEDRAEVFGASEGLPVCVERLGRGRDVGLEGGCFAEGVGTRAIWPLEAVCCLVNE